MMTVKLKQIEFTNHDKSTGEEIGYVWIGERVSEKVSEHVATIDTQKDADALILLLKKTKFRLKGRQ